jgi:hypothetical protein
MSVYIQPERELTEEEKLYAALVDLNQRIPCGGQICLGLNLETAIAKVEAFFTEHKLSLKDELIGELMLWQAHAEQGLKFSQHCDRLMQQVLQLVDGASKQQAQ